MYVQIILEREVDNNDVKWQRYYLILCFVQYNFPEIRFHSATKQPHYVLCEWAKCVHMESRNVYSNNQPAEANYNTAASPQKRNDNKNNTYTCTCVCRLWGVCDCGV